MEAAVSEHQCPLCGGALSGAPAEVWVFGCFSEAGHYLHTVRGAMMPRDVPYEVARACDGGFGPREQVEGATASQWVREHGGEAWSFVSWWDRRGDKRQGSHTGILARGRWSAAQLTTSGRALAPWAFRVEVADAADLASDPKPG